ncbi:unnamed protein product [Sphagnum troendelagicum]|uniref:Uncharacterized protein n=1 Tax=Sphagnum troendelagicum TaxID=128251 RepID=A0ABP0TK52_9BRYO
MRSSVARASFPTSPRCSSGLRSRGRKASILKEQNTSTGRSRVTTNESEPPSAQLCSDPLDFDHGLWISKQRATNETENRSCATGAAAANCRKNFRTWRRRSSNSAWERLPVVLLWKAQRVIALVVASTSFQDAHAFANPAERRRREEDGLVSDLHGAAG